MDAPVETLVVSASYEVVFALPEWVTHLDLRPTTLREPPNQYQLRIVVQAESAQEAQNALRTLRQRIIAALSAGENL